MKAFNLIEEQWIPVRLLSGHRGELGVRDTLLRAAEIAAIEDTSPLVVAALHRFLLAVLYRAMEGPTDIRQAERLFREGIRPGRINAYLDKWLDRFWLFHDEHPFFQVPDYDPKRKKGQTPWRSWTTLAAEHNADNAKVLFDHVDVVDPGTIPSSKASRWLLSCQTFAIASGNSDFQYTKSGPSATAVMIIPIGRDLQDSLLFSLVPENRAVLAVDMPVWERRPESLNSLRKGMKRSPRGYADLYTWRTRSIRFEPLGNGAAVHGLAFASGLECDANTLSDPMLAYRIDKKNGKLPLFFRKERGVWRDFDSLLPDRQRMLAPRVIAHAADLAHLEPDRFPRAVLVLGQANDHAKVTYWRQERFTLPGLLAGDRFAREGIRQLLDRAEATQMALSRASRAFARHVLSRGKRKPAPKDVDALVRQIDVSGWYWSILESSFHETLADYAKDSDPDDIRANWLEHVHSALSKAWQRHCVTVSGGSAWTIRALTMAEGIIGKELHDLRETIARSRGEEVTP